MLVIDFGNQVVLWGVLRKYFKRHAPKYVLYVLICHGVVTNLLYYDVMPEKQNKIIDKGQYDTALSFTLFIICCINYNSLKFTTFLIFPTYMVFAFI